MKQRLHRFRFTLVDGLLLGLVSLYFVAFALFMLWLRP